MPPASRRKKPAAPPRPWAVLPLEVVVRESDGTRVRVTMGGCPCPDSTWSDHPRNAGEPHACKHQMRAWNKAAQLALLGRIVDVVNEVSDETPGLVYPVTIPKCHQHGTPFAARPGKVTWCEHLAAAHGTMPGWLQAPAPQANPTGDPAPAADVA